MSSSSSGNKRSYRLGDEYSCLPNSFQIKLLGLPSSSSPLDYLGPIWTQFMEEVGFVSIQNVSALPNCERFRLPELDCDIKLQWITLGPTLLVHGTYQGSNGSRTFSWQWPPSLAVVSQTTRGPRFQNLDRLSREFKNAVAWPLLVECRSDLRLPLPPHSWISLPPEIVLVVVRYLDRRSVARLERTCRRSRQFVVDANIWAYLFARDFPNRTQPEPLTPALWKQAYKTALRQKL